jgi:hypothetical protein
VANHDKGLQVLDVADRAHPSEIGLLDEERLYGVAVNGHTVYASDGSGSMHVIDISDPYHPQEKSNLSGGSSAYDIAYDDGYAYVTNSSNGLKTYDVRDPLNPQIQSTFRLENGNVKYAAVEDSLLIMNVSYGNMVALNVSDRSNPVEIGRFGYGLSINIAFSGSTGYLASGTSGITIIDLWDPGHPGDAIRFSTIKFCSDIMETENTAFAAVGASGLLILDITNPFLPVQTGLCDTKGYAQALAKKDNLVYVADRDSGLCIIDVMDPADPVEIGHAHTAGEAWDVAVKGSTAYVANQSAGLCILDVSDPAHPLVAGSLDMPGECMGVATCGAGHVILAGGSMVVVDVQDPSSPVQIGAFDSPGECTGLAVAGYYDTEGAAEGVALNNGLIYVLCGESGFYAVRFDGSTAVGRRPSLLPQNTALAQNFPNPFNPTTTIPFTIGEKGRVAISVFDVTGRCVATVLNGEMPAGRHSIPFHADGLGSGMYFYRLEIAGCCLYRKMLVLN